MYILYSKAVSTSSHKVNVMSNLKQNCTCCLMIITLLYEIFLKLQKVNGRSLEHILWTEIPCILYGRKTESFGMVSICKPNYTVQLSSILIGSYTAADLGVTCQLLLFMCVRFFLTR